MKKSKLIKFDAETMEFIQNLIQDFILLCAKEVPHEEEYYDTADMKKLFHVDDSTLYRYRKTKRLPYKKLWGKIYYPKSGIQNVFKI